MSGEALVRDALEVLFVVATGGMLWSAVRRVRAGKVKVEHCAACRRPTSRAYRHCPRCGTAVG